MSPLIPGGRWARVLDATADRPLARSDLLRATQSGRHSRKTERRKLWRALGDMHNAGLIVHTPRGVRATAHGVRCLTEADLVARSPSHP